MSLEAIYIIITSIHKGAFKVYNNIGQPQIVEVLNSILDQSKTISLININKNMAIFF